MKTIFSRILFVFMPVLIASFTGGGCSNSTKPADNPNLTGLEYQLTLTGKAMVDTSIIEVNECFTNMVTPDERTNSAANDELASALYNDNKEGKNGMVTGLIEQAIVKIHKNWLSFDIHIIGFVEEPVTSLRIDVDKRLKYKWDE